MKNKILVSIILVPLLVILLNSVFANISSLEEFYNIRFSTEENRNLSNSNIRNTDSINNVENFTYLMLSNNKISKIEGLEDAKKLEKRNLSNNKISKMEGLENLRVLYDMDLSYNKISKMEELENLESLHELQLDNNEISKMEGLEKSSKLKALYLDNNNIEIIENLEKIENNGKNNLHHISLIGNLIKGITQEILDYINEYQIYVEFNGLDGGSITTLNPDGTFDYEWAVDAGF